MWARWLTSHRQGTLEGNESASANEHKIIPCDLDPAMNFFDALTGDSIYDIRGLEGGMEPTMVPLSARDNDQEQQPI